jgi:hypothetical protein
MWLIFPEKKFKLDSDDSDEDDDDNEDGGSENLLHIGMRQWTRTWRWCKLCHFIIYVYSFVQLLTNN